MLLYPFGQGDPSGDGPACSALVDVATLSLASPVLARAWRNLKCFQVVFKASFCSCRAPPVPSEEAESQKRPGAFSQGPTAEALKPEAGLPGVLSFPIGLPAPFPEFATLPFPTGVDMKPPKAARLSKYMIAS